MFGRLSSKAYLGVALASLMALVLQACGGAAPATTPKPAATVALAATVTAAPSVAPTRAPVVSATAAPFATMAPLATATPALNAEIPGMGSFPQAKRGGVLNVRAAGSPAGWEPYKQISINTHGIMINMYDTLVGHDMADYSVIVPYLARSWSQSPDGLQWTLQLNKGVSFHDGTPMTAKDVAFTFNSRLINRPSNLATPRGTLSLLKEVIAVDDYTVRFRLDQPYASFISSYLAYNRMMIYSKAWGDANNFARMDRLPTAPYTGPFTLREYIADNSVDLVRHPNYWVPGRPFLDGIKLFIIPDAGAALANFLTGQIHALTLTDKQQAEARSRLGDKVVLQNRPGLAFDLVQLNTLAAPLNDVRVRKAVGYALDKEGVSAAVGRTHVPGGFLFPGGGFALSDQELTQFAGYDRDHKANVQKAKALLAEAGYPNGFKANYFTRADTPGNIASSVIIQSFLKEVGITGELKLAETTDYFNTLEKHTDPSWFFTTGGQSINGGDPNDMLESYMVSWGVRNSTSLTDKFIDDAYYKQNAAQDPADRKKIIQDLERFCLGLYHYDVFSWTTYNLSTYSFVKNDWVTPSVGTNSRRDVWLER